MQDIIVPQKENNEIYVRHEQNGVITINSSEYGLKFLNKTAGYIYDICDGRSSVSDLEAILENRYPNISKEIIRSDLEEALYYLRDLKLVQWSNNDQISDGVRVVFNGDYRKAKEFVCHCIDNPEYNDQNNLFLTREKSYFDEYAMRDRQFSFAEINIAEFTANKITHFLTLTGFDPYKGIATVSTILGDAQGMAAFFEKAERLIFSMNVHKLKIVLVEGYHTYKIPDSLGFVREAILERECGEHSVLLYYKFIA